jgi:hypothetical protein
LVLFFVKRAGAVAVESSKTVEAYRAIIRKRGA